jgi:hypothetical protein
MEDSKKTILKLKENLTLVEVEDSGVVLDVEKRCYYDLNDTAFFLVNLMEGGCRREQLQIELTSEFHVDRETAHKDIDTFIKELMRLDLLSIGEEEEQKRATISGQGGRLYHTPVLEYQRELAVASAAIAVTPDVD